MRSALAAAVASLVLLVGCADYSDPQPGPLPSPNPSTAEPPLGGSSGDPDADGVPATSADLTIGFGRIGPARVGMSKEDALATDVFRIGNPAPVDGCPEPPLLWKPQFAGVDVLTTEDGTITAMGVSRAGPETVDGVGVGSTLADLTNTYGVDLTDPAEAGFGQSGAFLSEGDGWIGFLFDSPVADLDDTSPVTFVEVTRGSKPDLMRSGC